MKHAGDASSGYARARRTLIEAARALEPIAEGAFVLVGAHAVYLRTPSDGDGLPMYTFDGDLAANPARIARTDEIRVRLDAAGFELRGNAAGLYVRRAANEDEAQTSRIDVLVPAFNDFAWHVGFDARAAMSQPGLEVCLFDNSPMVVATLDDDGPPLEVTLRVAGGAALIIAKAWKLGERAEQGAEAFAAVSKDVTDLYRLLQATDPDEATATLRTIIHQRGVARAAREGAAFLRSVCTERHLAPSALREFFRGPALAIAAESLHLLGRGFVDAIGRAIPDTASAAATADK